MSYTLDDVARGRELVAALGRSQWALGDLALKVAPAGINGAHNDVLDKFSEEIGTDADQLRQYRWVAAAWPPVTRVTGATYSMHRELANNPSRRELMAEYMALGGRPSGRGLQAFLGKRPTPEFTEANRQQQVEQAIAEMTPDEAAAIAQKAMADPEVADKAMADPGTRSRTREAIDRQYEREREREQRRGTGHREPAPDPMNLVWEFRQLHRTIDRIAAEVGRRGAITSPAARDALLEETAWLANALAMIEEGLRGGTVEDALARILDEDAA